MSLYGLFQRLGPSGFGYNSTSDEVAQGIDLSGKTYLLTGCNSGIGLDTLRVLLLHGARVVAAARTEEKAKGAIASILGSKGEGLPVACELSAPSSVQETAQITRRSRRGRRHASPVNHGRPTGAAAMGCCPPAPPPGRLP